MRLFTLVCLVFLTPLPALAETSLTEFLAGEACAIGPGTRDRALAAGIAADAFDGFRDSAEKLEDSRIEGGWLVLAPADCTIALPKIEARLAFTDPDVARFVSGPEGVGEDSDPGCYIDHGMTTGLRESRGWDAARANREYFRLIAAGMVSGEVVFYGEDPLKTPVGMRYLGPGCDQAADVAAARAGHAWLASHFDRLIRELGAYVPCAGGAVITDAWFSPQGRSYTQEGNRNVWLGLELLIISMGADWHRDWDHERKGTPRPPLCREKPLEIDWSQMQ